METTEKNLGVILGQRASDYIGGTLPYEILNPDGNWEPFLPSEEWQRVDNLDFMACVPFSALNVIETLYFFLTGQRRNFSDRFTAYMSGTTLLGNWQWKVGDSIRKDGLCNEEDWPVPTKANLVWEDYYIPPTIEVINKAKEFLKDWTINYEFIDFTRESLIYHLKQSPIQVVFPNHAVMNFYTNESVYKYFDSYAPFIKERTDGFISALKYIMKRNEDMLFEQVTVKGFPKVGEENVYLVRNGKKTLVANANTLNVVGDFSKIKVISKEQLDAISDEDFGRPDIGGGSIVWFPNK